jgi:hypothetical protein
VSETIAELKTEYRECAAEHGKATLSGDYEAANRSYDKLLALVPKIRAYGPEGEAALLELSRDSNDAVACWSATHALLFDEARALEVLGRISKKAGPIGFNAKMVIQQWKKGELKI